MSFHNFQSDEELAIMHGVKPGAPMSTTQAMASCCWQNLSEWFIDRHKDGWWGMVCFRCRKVHPWLTHAEYREEQSATPNRLGGK